MVAANQEGQVAEDIRQIVEGLKALSGQSMGLFLAFEGGDGSGKTTQINRLSEVLQQNAAPVIFTREPGATDLGQEIRNLVMHGPEDIDPRTEALLYATDRAYHASTVIAPALKLGTTVITDRYIDSSAAYQGIGRGLGVDQIRDLSLWATDNLLPDAVIIFDVDPAVGMGRVGKMKDRLERAGNDFHQNVRDHYLAAASADPKRYRVIDANQDPATVFANLVSVLAPIVMAKAKVSQ